MSAIVSANAELDRDGSGFFITFVVEEGALFKFGTVNIETKLPGVNTARLQSDILTSPGALFDLSALDKTTEKLTLAVSEQGVAFARVRPQTARDPSGQSINVTYVIDEGPRVYIERINVNGNLRTQDYVIRREFRLAEGDAYNPLMVERAKKRLQSLGFFKAVDIKRRQGSAQDRDRARRRSGRTVDGRTVVRCRLLDLGRRHRRRLVDGTQPARRGPVPAPAPGRLG